ncbi:hypothetical protein [Paenibacillus ihumii]|uniref:hypothetical protein n=1 Tax=Paenibacillus ihumii TaxID=687436 RepID=UPI0011DCC388|nr:hypothetical protein [Paenibacillus ihumii]
MKNKYALFIILLLAAPILINYGLLSWRAPGVQGTSEAWIGFFANFLGLIGAVFIAFYQFRKQKEKEDEQDRVNNRSFVVIHDFNATLMLVGVVTNENSRIILTPWYEILRKTVKKEKYGTTKIPYLKVSHFGNPPIITDCSIKARIRYIEKNDYKIDELDISIGVIERDVEVFIPFTPLEADPGTKIFIEEVTFDYSTLKGERLRITRDFEKNTERLEVLHGKIKGEIIYEHKMKSANWVYPSKIDHSKI